MILKTGILSGIMSLSWPAQHFRLLMLIYGCTSCVLLFWIPAVVSDDSTLKLSGRLLQCMDRCEANFAKQLSSCAAGRILWCISEVSSMTSVGRKCEEICHKQAFRRMH